MKIVALIGDRGTGKSRALHHIASATGACVLANSDSDSAKLNALRQHAASGRPIGYVAVLDEASSLSIQFLQNLDGYDEYIVYVVPATTAAHDLLGIETEAMREEQNSLVPACGSAEQAPPVFETGYAAMLLTPIGSDEVAQANHRLKDAHGIENGWDFRFSVSDDGCTLFVKHTFGSTANRIFSLMPGVEVPRVLAAIQAVNQHLEHYDFSVVPSSVQPFAANYEKVGDLSLANFYKLSKGMDV